MLSHTPPQLARGALLSPVLLQPVFDANGQPSVLGGSGRRPWGTNHPREAAPWLAYGDKIKKKENKREIKMYKK